MAAPVPKPRTKFADSPSPNGTISSFNQPTQNEQISPVPPIPQPFENGQEVRFRRAQELEDVPLSLADTVPKSPSPPAVPPRPPAKPPRTVLNHSTAETFGNVIGELQVRVGETPRPPEIGLIPPVDPECMSPPTRHAPPPPRPPPPPGWKPEVGQKPLVPERGGSHSNRPLPAIPIDVDLSPQSGPSSSNTQYSGQQTIENPIYLCLDNFRAISGITPSPSNPPTESPDCEQVTEWLTEEEEAESSSAHRPIDLNISAQSGTSTSSHHEENPYTPCPRRSDYSSSEFIGSTVDPFDDAFFSANSSRQSFGSSSRQNHYVSPHELFSGAGEKSKGSVDLDNVVEACAPEVTMSTTTTPSPLPHAYVNIAPLASDTISRLSDDSEENFVREAGKVKIDGSSIAYVGFVCLTSTRREKRLHGRLRNMQLSFHEDEESTDAVSGPFDIKDIYMFRQIRRDTPQDSASTSTAASLCSPILIHIGEKRTVVSFVPEDSSDSWMFMISEAWLSLHYGLTPALKDVQELNICGNVWIKHGTTGEWRNCAVGITNMTLYYMLSDFRDRILNRNCSMEELVDVDLRKVMTMRDRIDKTEFCAHVKHKRGPFSMTLNGVTLYIDSRDDPTTSNWFDAIDTLIKKPQSRLENLRLTGENVPVIVDKCIRFVSAYGMKSEGIYRRNGKVTEAKMILTKLTEDPVGYYPVQETDETVYAVADVLRQFFRKLDEPLFPSSSQADLFDLALEAQSETLWNRYAELIEQLPTVHHATLKKLVAHLRNVSEHATENRASVENLAKVFGASLFLTDSMEQKVFGETYNHQINAMIHLITGYDTIFQISMEEELSRQMVNDAEKKSVNAKKPSPDFMVAVHVWEKDNRAFNVKTSLACEEVCREAVAKRGFDGPADSPYAVFECLCEGQLVRRLPAAQKVNKCFLQWIDWRCKDAFLLFDHDKYRFDGTEMSCFTGKVKVAEPGSKQFKSYEVKIENGTSIAAFRNEKLWKSWPLDEVIWYVGAESSRKSPNAFNATMISASKTGYARHFPGFCFSFKEESERSRWMTALSHFTKSTDSEPLVYI
ncbi:unnamed protein product [Caenorhabditis sp. 36 PRJEB53466]|nr:unnamed protein product [Caenorhabditis sp. 36 PRJEB53466]